MRILLFIPMIFSFLFGSESVFDKAMDLYEKEEYAASLDAYKQGMKEFEGEKQAIRYNIAQLHLKLDTIPEAMSYFSQASKGGQSTLGSDAFNNHGAILATKPLPKADEKQGASSPGAAFPGGPAGEKGGVSMEQLQSSLEFFKSALRKNHDNETARFNYELVKKMMQKRQEQQDQENDQNEDQQEKDDKEKQEEENENKKQEEQDQPKKGEENQQNQQQDPQDQDQQNQQNNQQQKPGEEGQEAEMSQAQAKALLDALEENEKKFIQQLRKRNKKRPRRNDGPQW